MRFEERDAWGNLGNSKADPDDRSCRDLAPTMMRTWEGWEQIGARWAEKQGGEWSEIGQSLYYFIFKNLLVLVHLSWIKKAEK